MGLEPTNHCALLLALPHRDGEDCTLGLRLLVLKVGKLYPTYERAVGVVYETATS